MCRLLCFRPHAFHPCVLFLAALWPPSILSYCIPYHYYTSYTRCVRLMFSFSSFFHLALFFSLSTALGRASPHTHSILPLTYLAVVNSSMTACTLFRTLTTPHIPCQDHVSRLLHDSARTIWHFFRLRSVTEIKVLLTSTLDYIVYMVVLLLWVSIDICILSLFICSL